jgi:signal transduction histidine kinase
MGISQLIDYFIHPSRYENQESLRRARLLVRGCLLTSIFSVNYLFLSVYFEFEAGFYLMITNFVGFLLLPFLVKTRLPINLLGNFYAAIGAFAVIALSYYSGGIESALYAWIISIPILALLIVNRQSAYFWGAVSLLAMVIIGIGAIQDYEYPVGYNTSMRAEWLTTIYPGLLLIILFIALVFEYTQRKALEQLANQNSVLTQQKEIIADQKEKLAGLIEEKDYVIRILAHDLRSPLNNIKGLVKLMELDATEKEPEDYRALILQTTLNAENLVNRVLEMDQSQQEDLNIQMTELDILPLMNKLIQKMNELANKKSIQIHLINKAEKLTVKADKTYLNLIFENLISNGIKFSNYNKKMQLRLSNNAKYLMVEVIDEGPGIRTSEEAKLFMKFSKLSAQPTAGESSTGLGLSLVKRYVEMINGDVRYEKVANGNGANFIVEIPLVD